jgi:hypothetical protein
MGYPLQILIYFPKQYMTVVIVIGLFHSMKQVLWKKFPLFVQNIVLNATISQLAQSSDIYPIRTIGAAVTLARKLGSQHILHIKDAESDSDKAMVPLSISTFVLYFCMCMYLG